MWTGLQNAEAIRELTAKALGEGKNPGGPSKIDMDGYLSDVKAANEDKHLKVRGCCCHCCCSTFSAY